MRLLTLTQSVVITGMVAIVFPRDLNPFAGGFEIDMFTLIVFVLHNTCPPSDPQPLNGVEQRRAHMGANYKMDAEIPPDAREQCLRFKFRPTVRVLVLY